MKMPMELEALRGASDAVIRKGRGLPTGFAVLLAGGLVAGALVFAALAQRYVVSGALTGYPARIDRLTGAVEICSVRTRDVEGAERSQNARYYWYECAPELKQ